MIWVVGGHSRNVGKTSVVAGLIRAFRDRNWTALKITQYGHSVCSKDGDNCGCQTDADHPYAVSRETSLLGDTDTSRFLAAGANECYWLRTRMGELGFALPFLKRLIAQSDHLLVESNSVLQFIVPDLYLAVMDTANPDFKASSLRYLDRANAILYRGDRHARWPEVSPRLLAARPQFQLGDDFALPVNCLEWLELQLPALESRDGRAPRLGPAA